ncbi:MAG: NAD(+) diphosphatase [Pseudomonadota bacterium]
MTTSNDIPLAQKPIERAAHRRLDADWLETNQRDKDVLIFLFRAGEPFLALDGKALVWMGPEAWALAQNPLWVFLGEDKNESPIFALDLPESFDPAGSLVEGIGQFEDMRAAASTLSAMQANLAATARSLFEWHRTHGFCARCGSQSESVEAGWKRVCPNCGAEHFPRTDPVAIMLAVKDDQCLLGRQAGWPAGFWSALAGFVEPGETVEQAASRELEEEAGIKSNPENAEYLFCQPWPFPSSLMIGIIIEADTMDIAVEQDELEAARWISRDDARQVLAGTHPDIYCPPPMAVAHHILKTWAERDA